MRTGVLYGGGKCRGEIKRCKVCPRERGARRRSRAGKSSDYVRAKPRKSTLIMSQVSPVNILRPKQPFFGEYFSADASFAADITY